jgi:hypothetical protein
MLETTQAAAAPPLHGLDRLADLDGEALAALYRAAPPPTSVGPLEGAPRGRMLAVRGLDRGLPAGLVRRLARASFFPWGGKSFSGQGAHGAGINRVALGPGGRHQLFPFATSIGTSRIDGAPAILLDYDRPENPAPIRAIHDEVRAIEPGLYLGPAMWKRAGGPALVLWFALDNRAGERV